MIAFGAPGTTIITGFRDLFAGWLGSGAIRCELFVDAITRLRGLMGEESDHDVQGLDLVHNRWFTSRKIGLFMGFCCGRVREDDVQVDGSGDWS